MKQYRIGEYAKYLGVTPDLLKHYEEIGLIQPSRTESGYRYYPFHTTVLLIESVRMRNYGMTLREMTEILARRSVPSKQIERRFSENMEHLRQEAALDQLLAEDYAAFERWREPLLQREFDWDVHWSRPMLFLPHADADDFLEDPRIYELLKDWMSYIPLVKSTVKIEAGGKMTWGFITEESMAEQLKLPRNTVVQRIPSRKIFYYKFRGPLTRMPQESPDAPEHPAFRQLRSMHLQSGTTYFRTTLMPADWENGLRSQYGYYAIPLLQETT